MPFFFIFLLYYQSLSLATRTCINESLTSLRQVRKTLDERLALMDQDSMWLNTDIANANIEETVSIIDNNGTILYQSDSGRPIDVSRLTQTEGFYREKRDIVVYTMSPESGLFITVFLPHSVVMNQMISIRRTILLMVIVLILVELFFIASFIRYNANPIVEYVRKLSVLLSDKEAKNQSVNEVPQPENLSVEVKRKRFLLREYFLSQFLEGYFKDSAQILALAAETGFQLGAAAYCAVTFGSCGNPEKLLSLLEQVDHPTNAFHSLLYHNMEQDMLFTLYGFFSPPDDAGRRNFINYLEDMVKHLKEYSGSAVSAGVGNIYTDITNVCFSYNQSCYSAALAAGKNEIVDYNNIPFDTSSFFYPASLEQKLINSTGYRETAKIDDVFDEIIRENLEKRNLSAIIGSKLAESLSVTLLKLYTELKLDRKSAEEAAIRVSKFSTLPELLKALRSEFIRLGERPKKTGLSSRHEILLNEIMELIHKKYTDPMLSVVYIADQFHLSESYFSHLFKGLSGESFSVYLEKMRLAKARELLRDTYHDIEEISRRVGYFNSTSFRRAFKRMYGISPSAFRSAPANVKDSSDYP